MLHRLADLLEQSLEELAQAESRDQGECGALGKGQYNYSDAGDAYPPSSRSGDLLSLSRNGWDSGTSSILAPWAHRASPHLCVSWPR